MSAWEQFTLDGAVERVEPVVRERGDAGEQLGWGLGDAVAAGQLVLGAPSTGVEERAPLLVAGCVLCPVGRDEWSEAGGVVHWNLADPSGPGAGVVVHARSNDEAVAMLREWQGARKLSPVAHVSARRCMRCSAWSTLADARRREVAIGAAVREVAEGLVEPVGAVTVAERVGIGEGCWNWTRVGVVLDALVAAGALVRVAPLVEGAGVRYAVPGWDGRLV